MGYLSIVNMSFPYKYYHCSLLCSCYSLTHQTRSLNLRWNSNSNATQSVQTIMKMLSTTPCNFQDGKCSIFRVQTNSVWVQNFTRANRNKLISELRVTQFLVGPLVISLLSLIMLLKNTITSSTYRNDRRTLFLKMPEDKFFSLFSSRVLLQENISKYWFS